MRCPHELLPELGIPEEAAAKEFAPRFGMTASLAAWRSAVQAARDTRHAWASAVEAGNSVYAFTKTHPAWLVDGQVTDGCFEAIQPHLKGIERAMELGAAPPIAWGRDLARLYSRAAEAARAEAAKLEPHQGVGIDELLSAADFVPAFGLAPAGDERDWRSEAERAEAERAEAERSEAERSERAAMEERTEAERSEAERAEAERAAMEAEWSARAEMEHGAARRELEQLAALDGRTEADGASWWSKLSAAVSGVGAKLAYARTLVWRTIVAVSKIAFPVALLATAVFAVLFACCTMLTSDTESELSVCAFVRTLCGAHAGGASVVADVSKLQGSTFQKALAIIEMQRLTNGGAGAAKILKSIAFPSELKKEFLQHAFDLGDDDLKIAQDDLTMWQMFKGMFGWYSPDATQAIQNAGDQVDPNYLSVIQKLYECQKLSGDDQKKRIADLVGNSSVQDYLGRVYGHVDHIDSLTQIMGDNKHMQFVRDMHKFAWQQFTPLASVLGRAQGGALRLVGDAIGLNDGFADKAAGFGAALVALSALAGFYLGPAAAASVLATTAALYAGYDLTGEPTTAVGLGVTVMGFCRSFVPTTASEDHALDRAAELAMGISSAMQTSLNATREAERQAKLAHAEFQATMAEATVTGLGALAGPAGVALAPGISKGAGALIKATAARNANRPQGTAALFADVSRPFI